MSCFGVEFHLYRTFIEMLSSIDSSLRFNIYLLIKILRSFEVNLFLILKVTIRSNAVLGKHYFEIYTPLCDCYLIDN